VEQAIVLLLSGAEVERERSLSGAKLNKYLGEEAS